MTHRVVAIVGMTGSGKSEVAYEFEAAGYSRIRFGDVTDEEVRKRGRKLNEANERSAREGLRAKLGMAAYAILNAPRIDAALKKNDVVVDGLYSWEEYLDLKARYGSKLTIVAVWAPPEVRYARLTKRVVRPLTADEAGARDRAEIENVNKGGPIAMADHMLANDSTLTSLKTRTRRLIARLK